MKPRFARAAMLLLALSCASVVSNANAQSADTMASVSRSITVVKNSDLLFGDFIAGTTNSNFRMHAVTGNLIQQSGDAVSIGGTQSRASFTATGTPFAQANIRRSQNSIDIVRDGGSETMRVDNFWLGNSGGLRDQILDAAGQATYFVGGRLRIGPNQAAGTYRGTFNVTIEYQ
ncbi:MAG: DUF4402 domain-containing protein [Parasphingorhabdus sp.]|uniref:DUF4402 domain-containing protein n=1 Tax=Parasphingorhabdus sp. TaxID=2709688 RepID=UPI003298BA43